MVGNKKCYRWVIPCFYAQFSNFIWAVEKYGNVISYFSIFFENGSFCNYCVGKVAECFWGHIVTLCRPRHLIQCKFAHFVLPRLWPFLPTLSSPAPPILWPPVKSSEAHEKQVCQNLAQSNFFHSWY